jgi:phage terminase large subunit
MRNILAQCWFDADKCAQGITALENWQAEYDETKKKLGNKPLHNWASHGADAFRTFAVGYKGIKESPTLDLERELELVSDFY